MDLRNTEGRERFNVVELPIDAEKKEGTKLQQAMSDLLNYWYICMDGKDVPNALRYSICEEITNRLAFALAILSRSVERYNYNFRMNQPENRDKYRVPYKPFDILQDSRKAEDEFAIVAYMIKSLYERPQFKRRKSELKRLTGICKKMMRGWLIYLTTHGGK